MPRKWFCRRPWPTHYETCWRVTQPPISTRPRPRTAAAIRLTITTVSTRWTAPASDAFCAATATICRPCCRRWDGEDRRPAEVLRLSAPSFADVRENLVNAADMEGNVVAAMLIGKTHNHLCAAGPVFQR